MVEEFIRIRGSEDWTLYEGSLSDMSNASVTANVSIDQTDVVTALENIQHVLGGDISVTAWNEQSRACTERAAYLAELATYYSTQTGPSEKLTMTCDAMGQMLLSLAGIDSSYKSLRQYHARQQALEWQPPVGDSDFEHIDAALWSAQTAYIAKEITYLQQLNAQFKAKQSALEDGKLRDAIDLTKEVLEEAFIIKLTKFLATKAAAAGASSGAIGLMTLGVAALTDFLLGKAFDYLVDLLKEGNGLLEAMIAEDTTLKGITTPSLSSYEARADVLQRHVELLKMLLEDIARAEEAAKIQTQQAQEIVVKTEIDGIDGIEGIDDIADNINALKDALGDTAFQIDGFEDIVDRLEDIAVNDTAFRVGDVEISTKGRYIKH